jgi:hypothetical protein
MIVDKRWMTWDLLGYYSFPIREKINKNTWVDRHHQPYSG